MQGNNLDTYIISVADIGRTYRNLSCPCCGYPYARINFEEVLHRVIPSDVGKLMKRTAKGVWQVENDEQFMDRIKNQTK